MTHWDARPTAEFDPIWQPRYDWRSASPAIAVMPPRPVNYNSRQEQSLLVAS